MGIVNCMRISVILASLILSLCAAPLLADDASDTCRQHLVAIGTAIAEYRRDRGAMPANLVELVPKYLPDKATLRCPSDTSKGREETSQANGEKVSVSYGYEWNEQPVSSYSINQIVLPTPAAASGRPTNRAIREAQRYYFGDCVPIVRCYHGRQHVNTLTLSGQVYTGGYRWEADPEPVKQIVDKLRKDVKGGRSAFEEHWAPGKTASYFRSLSDFGEAPPAAVRDLLAAATAEISAADLQPGEATFMAASLYSGAGDVDQAIRFYAKAAVTSGRNQVTAFELLDDLFQEKGRLDDAVAFHRSRVAAEPSNVGYKAKLSYSLMQSGQAKEAMKWHKKVEPAAADACSGQLKSIGKSLQAYVKDNGKMPDELSDLYPAYISDLKLLHCPADPTAGSPSNRYAHKDPKRPVSYSYEFYAADSHGLPSPLGPFPKPDVGDAWGTNRHVNMHQRFFYGDLVPTVRCMHHRPPDSDEDDVLNLAYSGTVYRSTFRWEERPEAMMAVLQRINRDLAAGLDVFKKNWLLWRFEEHTYGWLNKPVSADARRMLESVADQMIAAAPLSGKDLKSGLWRVAARLFKGANAYGKALAACDEALKLPNVSGNSYDEHESVKSIMAECFRGEKQPEKALPILLDLQEKHPTGHYIKEQLAAAYEEAGQSDKAEEWRRKAEPGLALIGRSAPDFILPTPDGGQISLSNALRGKKALLVNFWFYGCGPCRAEFPHLKNLYTKLSHSGFELVAVNQGDSKEIVQKYVKEAGLPFKIGLGGRSGQPENTVFKEYGVSVYPTNYLIDSTGKVIFRSAGFDEKGLKEALRKIGLTP